MQCGDREQSIIVLFRAEKIGLHSLVIFSIISLWRGHFWLSSFSFVLADDNTSYHIGN
jgi:hypothetical protein